VDGKPLGEKKHWLQDDYVKFLRFAQWKIEQAGCGVVGMITNHGYLDNPTFRGMRQSLMRTFDEIYILDLHGNSLKKETCPDGSPDKNVFDIRQGVAIAFFIKRGGAETRGTVRHADVWGTRQAKYSWLNDRDLKHTDWVKLRPTAPFYLFVPRDTVGEEEYEAFIPVTELFPLNVTGIVTARDELCIDFNEAALLAKIRPLQDHKLSDDYVRQYLAALLGRTPSKVENYAWRIPAARSSLQDVTNLNERIVPILYRPFDVRKVFYHDSIVWRTRAQVMRHMLAGENLALITMRQVSLDEPYTHVLATSRIVDNRTFVSSKGITTELPLYLYPAADQGHLFAPHEPWERKPNLNAKLVAALAEAYGRVPTPEEIFHYVYAVLYAPTYREKYAEFLRMDFPRVPFTTDAAVFKKLAALGKRLTALHLLISPELDPPACRFEGQGDSRIAKGRKAGLRYEPSEQRVYINATQYFAPVPEPVWTYRVGGYQVCEKWLKDRQERRLEVDDIRTYCRIVTTLRLSLGIQQEIDALYPQAENRTVVLPRSVDAPSHPAS
jgi:predicted helicase